MKSQILLEKWLDSYFSRSFHCIKNWLNFSKLTLIFEPLYFVKLCPIFFKSFLSTWSLVKIDPIRIPNIDTPQPKSCHLLPNIITSQWQLFTLVFKTRTYRVSGQSLPLGNGKFWNCKFLKFISKLGHCQKNTHSQNFFWISKIHKLKSQRK